MVDSWKKESNPVGVRAQFETPLPQFAAATRLDVLWSTLIPLQLAGDAAARLVADVAPHCTGTYHRPRYHAQRKARVLEQFGSIRRASVVKSAIALPRVWHPNKSERKPT